jgi:hypothetical protein
LSESEGGWYLLCDEGELPKHDRHGRPS